ncbi:hypothetical protein EV363DRAFT_1175806, partial [Boletus edulis]
RDTLKIVGIKELEERKAKCITYEHPFSPTMLLTFVFNATLHEGALGVIKTLFLVFKRITASREFVNINKNDIPIIHICKSLSLCTELYMAVQGLQYHRKVPPCPLLSQCCHSAVTVLSQCCHSAVQHCYHRHDCDSTVW